MSYWYIHKPHQCIHYILPFPCANSYNRPVKVMDAKTRELKRWETARGKPIALIESGSLVLTTVGKRLRYKVKNGELAS